jgi:hypothetical protein
MGIYHHPPPADLQSVGVSFHEVKDTWTNEAIAFASSYAAKTALWLRRLPAP